MYQTGSLSMRNLYMLELSEFIYSSVACTIIKITSNIIAYVNL